MDYLNALIAFDDNATIPTIALLVIKRVIASQCGLARISHQDVENLSGLSRHLS